MWAVIVAAFIGPVMTAALGRFVQVRFKSQDVKVAEVHELVNSKYTDAQEKIKSLEERVRELTPPSP